MELSGKAGLLAIDLRNGTIQVLSDVGTLGWLSPHAQRVLWAEGNYGILLDATTGARDVVASARAIRLYDNGTVLEAGEGEIRWRDAKSPTASASAEVPPAPVAGTGWTQASDDIRVVGVEYLGPAGTTCLNDLYVRGSNGSRTAGCHLRVAADGRAGWTELSTVRIRGPEGIIETVRAPSEDTRLENPIFTADGYYYLRVHDRTTRTLTEIVDQDGEVVATLTGAGKMALLDATADGNLVLANVFRAA